MHLKKSDKKELLRHFHSATYGLTDQRRSRIPPFSRRMPLHKTSLLAANPVELTLVAGLKAPECGLNRAFTLGSIGPVHSCRNPAKRLPGVIPGRSRRVAAPTFPDAIPTRCHSNRPAVRLLGLAKADVSIDCLHQLLHTARPSKEAQMCAKWERSRLAQSLCSK